jgi:hypothetical protein
MKIRAQLARFPGISITSRIRQQPVSIFVKELKLPPMIQHFPSRRTTDILGVQTAIEAVAAPPTNPDTSIIAQAKQVSLWYTIHFV